MAVGRQLNVKGQMRIDVPHLRLIESGVVYDFDTLAGGILAGKLPYVVTGFVPAAWTNGSPATSLSLVTADSIFVNYQASENGSMLMVPANRLPEALTVTNSRVIGSFTVSQTNYVSLDLTRTEDASTSDVVHFIDPATLQGTPKIIPLGRTMDYQIYISTSPFSTSPQRCPVMKVVTDANNNIVSVTDARPMMFRLAAGGDAPNVLAKYSWPQGRTEAANSFVGGDKAIGDMKSWVSAVEEMIWQINAGEYWYSNTQMTSTWFMPGSVSEWSWNLGTETISWSASLEIVFTGSTAMHNTIAAGSIVLPANSALYVDFNRYTNGAALTPHVALISTMGGEPTTPGIRYPIAWRVGSGTPAVRNFPVPVGTSLVVGTATTTANGTVRINTADATPYAVISDGVGGTAIANGLKRATVGLLALGVTANETFIELGGGVNNQQITIGRSAATLGSTSIFGKTVIVGESTSLTNVNGDYITLTSAQTTSIRGLLLSAETTALALGSTATTTISMGCNLLTGTTNSINIGTGHAGTGASTITIGKALIGTSNILGANVNVNTTGNGAVTTIGNAIGTTVTNINGNTVDIYSAGDLSTTCTGTLLTGGSYATVQGINVLNLGTGLTLITNLVAVNNLNVGSAMTTGAITVGSATIKARAAAATVGGDNSLTLATKGYVDSGGTPSWTTITAFNGTWSSSDLKVIAYGGRATLRGSCYANASPGTFAFALSAEFRPTAPCSFPIVVVNVAHTTYWLGTMDIAADGVVTLYRITTYGSTADLPANDQQYFINATWSVL
jgi:hypothetical protein